VPASQTDQLMLWHTLLPPDRSSRVAPMHRGTEAAEG
jgi:hypothetical protein